jgi:hypothetical protein
MWVFLVRGKDHSRLALPVGTNVREKTSPDRFIVFHATAPTLWADGKEFFPGHWLRDDVA